MGLIVQAFIFVLMMAALTLFFIPTIIAISRKHANALPIFLTNLYLGVTFIGWAVALIWAFAAEKPAAVQQTQIIPLNHGAGGAVHQSYYAPSKKFGALHYILIIGAALLAAVVVLFILSPTTTGVQQDQATSKIRSGVPMSADELLGNVQTPAGNK